MKFDLYILVHELNKRKAQEVVENAVLSKMPKLGEKGTLLDYQDTLDDSEPKGNMIQGSEHYPFYQEGSQGSDLQKAWADYYAAGGTPEAAAAYYSAQGITIDQDLSQTNNSEGYNHEQAQYGYSIESYETSERLASGVDNSIYALPNSGEEAQKALDAILTEATPEPSINANGSSGLVAYDSD